MLTNEINNSEHQSTSNLAEYIGHNFVGGTSNKDGKCGDTLYGHELYPELV